MSKKRCLRSESLYHDVIEHILERVPLKPLLRFKAVSKQWKSTIESRNFHERVWKHHRRQQSGDPDVLFVSACSDPPHIELLRTLVLGSSSLVNIPTPWETQNTQYLVSSNSCDGLVCLFHPTESGFVVNPTTRWYRPLPLCGLQQLIIDLEERYFKLGHKLFNLGFGKDIFTGTYKAVWLYNSSEIGLKNATTCEVFDFSTSSWRYVTPASPYRVVGSTDPVFVDGSLHWFTECQDTKVVSFDLHTEAFQVISKAPFANPNPSEIVMCNLDNRLCVSLADLALMTNQVIWSFNSSNKTWDNIYMIDLFICAFCYDVSPRCVLQPLALLDGGKKKKKTKKLLFSDHVDRRALLTFDPETKSESSSGISYAFWEKSIGFPVCYFPSLFSIQ